MITLTEEEVRMILDALDEGGMIDPDYDQIDSARDFLRARLIDKD